MTDKLHQASREKCVIENDFSYFSTKTYVVDTQKNHLNEMVLSNTQNTWDTRYWWDTAVVNTE